MPWLRDGVVGDDDADEARASAALAQYRALRLRDPLGKRLRHRRRVVAKGVGEGIELYAKGEGAKNFRPWLKRQDHLQRRLYLALDRVDKGVRQDSKTEAASAAYFNRDIIVEFLRSAMYSEQNVLRDNLYVMLTSLEIVGAMRGRAAFHGKMTTRLRFFSASNSLDDE